MLVVGDGNASPSEAPACGATPTEWERAGDGSAEADVVVMEVVVSVHAAGSTGVETARGGADGGRPALERRAITDATSSPAPDRKEEPPGGDRGNAVDRVGMSCSQKGRKRTVSMPRPALTQTTAVRCSSSTPTGRFTRSCPKKRDRHLSNTIQT